MEKIDLNKLWKVAQKKKEEEHKRLLDKIKRDTKAEIKEAAKLVKEALEAKNFRISQLIDSSISYREIIIKYEKRFEHLHPVLTEEVRVELEKLGVCPDKIKLDLPHLHLYIQSDN